MIAAFIGYRYAVAPLGYREQNSFQRRRPVKALKLNTGIPAAQAVGQHPAPATITEDAEHEAIANRGAKPGQQFLAPQPGVINALDQASGRQNARTDGVAHAETGQGVLESGMFADYRVAALNAGTGKPEVGETAERTRIFHLKPGPLTEHGDGALDVIRVAFESLEHATGYGSPAAVHQKVGITVRGQRIIETQPIAVRHIGLEHITGGDGVGDPRASGQDRRTVDCLDPIIETDLDAGIARAIQQAAAKTARIRPPMYQVIQRLRASDLVSGSPGIEGDAVVDRMGIEVYGYSVGSHFLKYIGIVAPVFQALKIAVKPRVHGLAPFADENAPSGPRQYNRADQPGGTGADNGYLFALTGKFSGLQFFKFPIYAACIGLRGLAPSALARSQSAM